MKTATITEAKNRLSSLIDRVRGGESILILDRGVPVARLGPVAGFSDPTGRLRRLERAGLIRVGEAPPPLELLRKPAPAVAPGTSAVEALLADRRDGR
jgi:prevent-host-death family protein